jgi:dihydrofolate synthase/folylpolyglutamate synthase
MDFEETLDWLYSYQKFGIKLGLERITHITKELGDPQRNYNIIHVGGTNGKYSVCMFLESILKKNGYKVGVFTSPHLIHISERIIVDSIRIGEDEIVTLVKAIKPIVEKMIKNDNPTFFEIFTALAFKYFSDREVDFAIIEVGLGGRYDATNIVNPMVTVITNVSLDHENILGKKIQNIAFEKAGIIKGNIPIVTAVKGDSLNIFKNVAKKKNAPLHVISEQNIQRIHSSINGQKFQINGFFKDYLVRTSMIGKHQGENIALAIGAIERIQLNGIYITDESIEKGIEKTSNPGRMEIIDYDPIILLDGAHNISGMKMLSYTLKNDFDYAKLIVILGISSDKNIKSMLLILIPLVDIIITTRYNNTRACDPFKLKKIIEKLDYKCEIVTKNRIEDAINYAKSISTKKDLICVTGSLFTVGDIKKYLSTK